ncbi:unnamed protein product [Protopolystoma xenopodis]|uniref:Uncharacterized protein n=1 Tax=Protopolystoma xenopodis TaxID=117903 RepID=A0A448X584_9PLAT|nr:unnamed protein product [Protopolystoma xenopodis]
MIPAIGLAGSASDSPRHKDEIDSPYPSHYRHHVKCRTQQRQFLAKYNKHNNFIRPNEEYEQTEDTEYAEQPEREEYDEEEDEGQEEEFDEDEKMEEEENDEQFAAQEDQLFPYTSRFCAGDNTSEDSHNDVSFIEDSHLPGKIYRVIVRLIADL